VEAISSSEMSVDFTELHIVTEDRTLHGHRCDNSKFNTYVMSCPFKGSSSSSSSSSSKCYLLAVAGSNVF
jgi:hypothetical protein